MAVKVVFRMFDGQVVALFPELPANNTDNLCQSYTLAGGFGAEEPESFIENSEPAHPRDYTLVKGVLKQLGYTAEVLSEITEEHHEERKRRWREVTRALDHLDRAATVWSEEEPRTVLAYHFVAEAIMVLDYGEEFDVTLAIGRLRMYFQEYKRLRGIQ